MRSYAIINRCFKNSSTNPTHVLAHLLNHLDLLEHAGSVGGSWLTKDGERIIDMEPAIEELMDDETWPEPP